MTEIKSNRAWREECESLRQQLDIENATTKRLIAADRSMQEQLAATLAACKVKDEALDLAKWREQYSLTECPELYEAALAIKPDDTALKAWLGEPVAIMGSHGHPKHTSYILGIQEEKLYGPWIPLYAPKGMTK